MRCFLAFLLMFSAKKIKEKNLKKLGASPKKTLTGNFREGSYEPSIRSSSTLSWREITYSNGPGDWCCTSRQPDEILNRCSRAQFDFIQVVLFLREILARNSILASMKCTSIVSSHLSIYVNMSHFNKNCSSAQVHWGRAQKVVVNDNIDWRAYP